MDFKPFDAPPSDYHSLNSGLSTEGGVTAKGLIEGLNAYLAHLFAAVEGKAAPMIKAAKQDIKSVEPDLVALFAAHSDRISAIEHGLAEMKQMLDAFFDAAQSMHQASLTPATPPAESSDPVPPHPDQPADVQTKEADPAPHNALADILAGISGR